MHEPHIVNRRRLWMVWYANLLLIPLLSWQGRGWQAWLELQGLRAWLALPIVLILFGAVTGALVWLKRRSSEGFFLHALWFVTIFALLPWFFPIVEERIHFIVFGLFGFITLQVLPPVVGFPIVFAVAGLDEGFQAWLPDRVGDWRDVAVNVLAGISGAWFSWLGRRA